MYDGLRSLRVPGEGKTPRFKRGMKMLALVVALSLGAYGGYAVFAIFKIRGNIQQSQIQLKNLTESLPDEPINILVIGSDRRDVVEKGDPAGGGPSGQRADTIMLIHLSAKSKQRAVVVNFPRDLRVNVPGHGMTKINSAYAWGGADLMIKTVSQVSGVDIHHYVEINFASFRAIVDAVGGVRMYIAKPLRDPKAQLNIRETGCVKLNGRTALALVRSRNIYPDADFGRIQTQQRFMRALLNKVRSVRFLLDLRRVTKLSDALGDNVRHDDKVDIGLARAIAGQLATVGQSGTDMRVVPNRCCATIGGVSYVLLDEEKARELFRALKRDKRLPGHGKTGQSLPDPSDVSVHVVNATDVTGLAAREVEALRGKGYGAVVAGTASKQLQRTTIRFRPEAEMKARLLRKEYPNAAVSVAPSTQSAEVVLSLGWDIGSPTPGPTASPVPVAPNEPRDGPLLGKGCDA